MISEITSDLLDEIKSLRAENESMRRLLYAKDEIEKDMRFRIRKMEEKIFLLEKG